MALLVDTMMTAIRVLPLDGVALKDIKAGVGARAIDRISLMPGVDIWVDDEGMKRPGQVYWMLRGYRNPIAGNGVVLAIDGDGETLGLDGRVDVPWLMSTLAQTVVFIGDKHGLEMAIAQGWVDRPEIAITTGGVRHVEWTWRAADIPDLTVSGRA